MIGRRASKEFRKLARQIEVAGGEVRHMPRGHPKVYFEGRFVMTLCLTPSDHRSRKNELSRLRKAGLNI